MFTLNVVDENIFMIIKKDALEGIVLKKLPIEVYGFIRVDIFGKKYGMSFINISQEVFESHELHDLINKAKKMAFSNQKHI